MQETGEKRRHIHFNRTKFDYFLSDPERDLGSLTYNKNIDQIYYHFTTTLYTNISKFTNETSYKKDNINSNPWYEKDCKNAKKAIGDTPNEIIKL